jgi:two-component system chemotaxis response regulator CheY
MTNQPKTLIADDEKHIRLLIKTVLRSLDFDVVAEASNGKEAVELFREKRPDAVFLDINMPFMTGEDALREIMAIAPGTFAIMLTSQTDRESVERCIGLGAMNYIRKDNPLEEIKALVMESWRQHLEQVGG